MANNELEIIIWFSAIILGLFTSITILGVVAYLKTESGSAKSFRQLFDSSNLLRIYVVFIVVMFSVLLSLLGKISETSIIAILSSVAAYTLGGTFQPKFND